MATTKKVPAAEPTPAEAMRRCIGSVKFGIEAHDAPVADFPSQPSQKDGLGRMCKVDWSRYTAALRKAAIARQPAPAAVAEVDRARTDKAEAKATQTGKAKPAAKPVTSRTGKPSHKTAKVAPPTEEAAASAPDVEVAEEDAILVDRRQRVKAWRKSELEAAAVKA